MLLRELQLVNFRNYVRLGLAPGQGVTVLRGDNGQGKSNILEAIYFLATTRSPRAGSDRELVHWRARRDTIPFSRLEARVAKEGLDLHVEILIRADAEAGAPPSPSNGSVPSIASVAKQIKVNGLPTRAAELVGQLNVVLFTPDDVGLVAGSPDGRRRYLDVTGSQVSGLHLRALQRYRRIIAQRNQLLRQVRERRQPADLLQFWNDELVRTAAYVVARRLEMLRAINRDLGPLYRRLSGSEQTLELVYHATAGPVDVAAIGVALTEGRTDDDADDRLPDVAPVDEGALADIHATRIRELLAREIEQGVSLVGPHRDDFGFFLDGVDLNTYGSRGQQRLAVLALKLAEGEFMRVQTAERPILLLDDVLSELDPARRGFVLEQAGREGQTIITSSNLGDFPIDFLTQADLFAVEHGTVRAIPPPDNPTAEALSYAADGAPTPLRRVAE